MTTREALDTLFEMNVWVLFGWYIVGSIGARIIARILEKSHEKTHTTSISMTAEEFKKFLESR